MIFKSFIKKICRNSVGLQRLYIAYRKRQQLRYLPDWKSLIEKDNQLWREACLAAREKGGETVLLATSTGGHPSAPIMDSILAAALTLRGAEVSFLLCDSVLPACQMVEIGLMSPSDFKKNGPKEYFCRGCFERASKIFSQSGLKIHRYSEYIKQEDLMKIWDMVNALTVSEMSSYVYKDVPVGEHAKAGTLRYYAQSTVPDTDEAEQILKRYLVSAIATTFVVERMAASSRFGVVCVNHGIYVPHGVVAEAFKRKQSRIVAWNVAYRKRSFIFSHSDTYHHTLMTEPVSEWLNMEWSSQTESEIVDYLRSRERGGRDWIMFHDRKSADCSVGEFQTVLAKGCPVIGMLTNVSWDAQLHYPANAFGDMMEWVIKTIKYFAKRPDLSLVIRVHPAEISGDIPSRQPVVQEIQKKFPKLPENVLVLGPDNHVSTYKAMEQCNAVIIYGTKTGVELTSRGIPVVVAGEAWIRNKGLTLDAKSQNDYFQILDRLPFSERMNAEQVIRARKYAYHFFFRRMIPLSAVTPTGAEPQFMLSIQGIKELLPGVCDGLDTICNGILHSTSFIYHPKVDNLIK